MFTKPRNWFPTTIWKPKNPHSLEHLKYLCAVLTKNQIVSESNCSLLVETLRSISEILIWGDQNDSSVFDFFLEKNMLSFFIRYMRQKNGRYICIQLLQTLNILFENISNETSLYYLLSNNHINSIIVHRFDFSDEEIMAYFISFLKTLSLKLNKHTIHFFYNEHANDFALYTEAIKFFNQSESMVRIAVRTITLNVFKVEDKAMLSYIKDKTAAPYFSNLVWFIGNHILELDSCVRNDADHQNRDRLSNLVAEHLDHLHYLNDILCINNEALNDVLTEHLLNRLLIPLYVYSLTNRKRFNSAEEKKHVSSVVSLFLLSQVFLIISHAPLVRQLAEIIFQGDISLTRGDKQSSRSNRGIREFIPPEEPIEQMLNTSHVRRRVKSGGPSNDAETIARRQGNSTFYAASDVTLPIDELSSPDTEGALSPGSEVLSGDTDVSSPNQNSTDEEKLTTLGIGSRLASASCVEQWQAEFSLTNRPYLEAVFNALECSENDYQALFTLCLLYAMGHNVGIHEDLLDSVLMPTDRSETKKHYNVGLVERLIRIITLACQQASRVRLVTLELSVKLLKQLVYKSGSSYLQDRHLACVENAREASTQLLRNFYKSEEIFLDMFEDEYRELKSKPLNVEFLTMDESILLPPTGTPLTGIGFNKRLPCGEVERARRAIRLFLLIRELSLLLLGEQETKLPLTREDSCINNKDILDLNNSDLIACTVLTRESRKHERRFLVIDSQQLILVEPDLKRLGWGVVRFVGFLQDVEVTGDKDDSRSLHVTILKPPSSIHVRPQPLMVARFLFDDHIRCMAAKQRLTKGRLKTRQQKMQMIERLLEITANDPNYAMFNAGPSPSRSGPIPGRSRPVKLSSEPIPIPTLSSQRQPPLPMTMDRPINPDTSNPTAMDAVQSKPTTLLQEAQKCASVEEGLDVTSANAFQTFNQATGSTSRDRHLPSQITTSGMHVQEIPLEDMSKKARRRSSSGRGSQAQMVVERHGAQIRSHSHSPRRGRSISSSLPMTVKEELKIKERSTSVTTTDKGQGVSGSARLQSAKAKQGLGPRKLEPFHLTKSGSSSSQSSYSQPGSRSTSPCSRSRSQSGNDVTGQSPKTLLPAQAPALSLVPMGDDNEIPKAAFGLVPPTGTDSLRSLGEVSNAGCDSLTKESPNCATMLFKTTAAPEVCMSNASTGAVEMARDDQDGKAASHQLTKLAQLVHEHYKYDEVQTRASASVSTTSSEASSGGGQFI